MHLVKGKAIAVFDQDYVEDWDYHPKRIETTFTVPLDLSDDTNPEQVDFEFHMWTLDNFTLYQGFDPDFVDIETEVIDWQEMP